ncbi:MAG: c-type cytochrome [Verrucomicrobia bacterium]|nr:c-type cytochrome [Verrucomicrobiota bacterium]
MKKFLKWLGFALAGCVGLGLILAVVVYAKSNARLAQSFAVQVRPVAIPRDAAALERGRHIAETRGCNECHGKDYAGNKVVDDAAMGRWHGPNLTRGKGGRVATFRDEDWVRAIRHGVGPEGKGLYLMPADEYTHLSDEDLGVLVAFMKSVPPVDRERVPLTFGPVARALLTAGKIKLPAEMVDHAHRQPVAVTPGPTPEYGRYLANACMGCHNAKLSGGKIDIGPPDWPPAANLTPHADGRLAKWSEPDFVAAMRTAKRPDGTELNPVMPRLFGQMSDLELKALWAYFRTLPATPTGAR